MEMIEERLLVEEAKKDPQVFGVLFDRYYGKIYGYVLGRTGDVMVAQDLAAETFLKAFKNLWQFRWRGIAFSAWLYRIASNEIKRFFRSKKYQAVSLEMLMENTGFEPELQKDLEEEFRNAEHILEEHQKFLLIQKNLKKIPLKYQEVIALRFFEDMKVRQIAEITGKKEGTVKSLLSRGLEKLRQNVDQQKTMDEVQPFLPSRIIEAEGNKS